MTRNYDIVHYHAMGNGIWSIFPRIRSKTIVTLHGLDYKREKWGTLAKLFLRFNEKFMMPNKIISVSKNKKAIFIPNGIDIYKPIRSKSDYILFLSRIAPERALPAGAAAGDREGPQNGPRCPRDSPGIGLAKRTPCLGASRAV